MSTEGTATNLLTGDELVLDAGRNIYIDVDAFAQLGALNSLDNDLLRIGAYVYAADLAIKRLEREKHLRSLLVRIPVSNIHAFRHVQAAVEQALTTVSGDNWQLQFKEIPHATPAAGLQWPPRESSTLLFSGGLDSFAGAIDALGRERAVTLISHITHNRPVEEAQTALAETVREFAPDGVTHIQARVHGRNSGGLTFPSDTEREDTQRTRSFLFLLLAAVCARLSRTRRIVLMAENGQFAIHLPLTEARIASFSTHTAHPKFLAEMQEILRAVLICPDIEVTNPFCYLTKGEVVDRIPVKLRPQIEKSASCWRVSRVGGERTHCGECVPCLCRRIALEKHDVKFAEYQTDLFRKDIGALPPANIGKQNLLDICQFISFFDGPNRLKSELEFCIRFPDLFKPHVNRSEAIKMYLRFAAEARAVLMKHKRVRAVLG